MKKRDLLSTTAGVAISAPVTPKKKTGGLRVTVDGLDDLGAKLNARHSHTTSKPAPAGSVVVTEYDVMKPRQRSIRPEDFYTKNAKLEAMMIGVLKDALDKTYERFTENLLYGMRTARSWRCRHCGGTAGSPACPEHLRDLGYPEPNASLQLNDPKTIDVSDYHEVEKP